MTKNRLVQRHQSAFLILHFSAKKCDKTAISCSFQSLLNCGEFFVSSFIGIPFFKYKLNFISAKTPFIFNFMKKEHDLLI